MGEPMGIDEIAADYEAEFDRDVEEIAAERGCEVVISDERTLQLDLDTEADYERIFLAQARRLMDAGLITPGWEEWQSRSGNRHVQVQLVEPAPVETRIMLQALLGSDRVRELLNLRRHRAGIENPIRLFRPLKPAEVAASSQPDELPWDELPF